jgi:thiol-disulfide isomerase/thioredoxin
MTRRSLAVVLSLGVATAARADDELAAVNRPAPMFRLPVYNPKPVGSTVVGLEKFVGPDAADRDAKVVLLSFMASWCEPCKKEMPYLQLMHDRYRDFGLRVMMVSIDTEPDGQKLIDGMIEQHKVTFPVLKDRFNLVARRWLGSQSPLPSLFMVKPDGVVSVVHRGYNQEISTLLAKEIEGALGIKRLPPPPPAMDVQPASGTAPAPAAEEKPAEAKPADGKKKKSVRAR